jgi:hypothetical protein
VKHILTGVMITLLLPMSIFSNNSIDSIETHKVDKIIKINPLAINHYQLFFEKKTFTKQSFLLTGGYSETSETLAVSKNDNTSNQELDTRNWFFYPEYRLYGTDDMSGWHLGIYGKFNRREEDVKADSKGINYDHTRTCYWLGGGLNGGYQFKFFENWYFNIYGGLWNVYQYVEDLEFKHAHLGVDLSDYEKNVLHDKSIERFRFGIRLGFSLGLGF